MYLVFIYLLGSALKLKATIELERKIWSHDSKFHTSHIGMNAEEQRKVQLIRYWVKTAMGPSF